MQFDGQDWEDVRHLLPESVQALITLIGFEAAFELVRHLGGTTYPLRQGRTQSTASGAAYLEEIAGAEAAEKMMRHLAPCNLFVPKCEAAMTELRDRRIRRAFDRQTASGVPAYQAAADLALAHRLTDRHIWRILKRPDKVAEQGGLF